MAEEDQVVEIPEIELDSVSSEEEKVEAAGAGWVDRDKWKGTSPWSSAKDFLEKGRHTLPIVQKQNKAIRGELAREREAREGLESEIKALKAALGSVAEKQRKQAEAHAEELEEDLQHQIDSAVEADDMKTAFNLQRKLTKLQTVREQAREEPAATPAPEAKAPEYSPGFRAWRDKHTDDFRLNAKGLPANEWTARAVAAANSVSLRKNAPQDEEFYEAVDAEIARMEGDEPPARKVSKVAGGGDSRSGGGGSGRSYADLPTDARKVCDDYARELGYEDTDKIKAYRARYAKTYFEEPAA